MMPSTPNSIPAPAWLVPISGPPLRSIELKAAPVGLTIGRQDSCDVRLPSDAVSRLHARLRCEQGNWRIADLNSRWGTFLNGCRVSPDTDIPLQSGDLIRISPWTFNFSSQLTKRRTVQAMNDVEQMHTLVRSASHLERGGAIAEDRLALFLEAAASLHAAADEGMLAEALIEAACRGSGLPNAAVIRLLDAEDKIEILASRPPAATIQYSRSLLAAAGDGNIAEFSPAHGGDGSQSIIQMNVAAALCVPLMLGPTAAAYLYLDTRGGGGGGGGAAGTGGDSIAPRDWTAAVSFCLALARIASLALANLKRIDMERRAALIEIELRAAAEAQRWIFPRREVTAGPLRCFGQSRPGRYVGGDFFDIIPTADGRVVLALGDVAGKGIPASILMTAAQGFLNAALLQSGEVDLAVNHLNRFVAPRKPDDRFLTLWVGILDPAQRRLSYVDAGHGYAFLLTPEGVSQTLDSGDNLPVGVSDSFNYQAATVLLPASGQLLLVSDGIIEQPAADASATGAEFGIVGIRTLAASLARSADPIADLFAAVIAHNGNSPTLADDSTGLMARW
jgi:serine phosphatase RsbU (regulator of sigma subunit)